MRASSSGRVPVALLLLLIAQPPAANATTRHVPSEYPTIAAAMQAATSGDTVEVACQLIGRATTNLASAGTDAANECETVVDDCRDTLAGVDAAGDVALPDESLAALLGCELTLAQLDTCLAGVLGNARDAYQSSLSCSAAPAAGLDALGLVASPACFIVALRCPQLVASLGGPGPR